MDDFDHGLDPTAKSEPESDDVQLTMDDNGDDPGTLSLTLDTNGGYQLRSDSGQGSITYRVLQVQPNDDGQPQFVTSSQALLQNLINGSTEETNQPRITYIPAALPSNLDVSQVLDSRGATATAINSGSGPVYFMMAPTDVIQSNQRSLLPGGTSLKSESNTRIMRDDKRRSTHNEVERRRRDKINTQITNLGALLPDFTSEQSKQADSKSAILTKACEYVKELQVQTQEFEDRLRILESDRQQLQLLRQEYAQLKQENEALRTHLQQNGYGVEDGQDDSSL